MKTVTEFFGMQIKEAFRLQSEMIREARGKPKESEPVPAAQVEQGKIDTAPVGEAQTEAKEQATAKEEARILTADERWELVQKKRREEAEARRRIFLDLLASIREPLSSKVKEKFSWEEEKTLMAIDGLQAIDHRNIANLRRLVVLKPEKEGEKAPKDAKKVGELFYLAEYLFKPRPPRKRDPKDKGRGKKKRGKKPFFKGKGRPSKEGSSEDAGQPSKGRKIFQKARRGTPKTERKEISVVRKNSNPKPIQSS